MKHTLLMILAAEIRRRLWRLHTMEARLQIPMYIEKTKLSFHSAFMALVHVIWLFFLVAHSGPSVNVPCTWGDKGLIKWI